MLKSLVGAEAEEFVDSCDSCVSSFVAYDIYYHNPSTETKATDLAVLLGRVKEDVVFEANHLARKGVLKRNSQGAYVYNSSPFLAKNR